MATKQPVQRTLEFVQKHKDALAGSKIALEKAKQKSSQTGIMGTYWKGWYDGARLNVELYEHTLNAYMAEDPVFKDWDAAKKKFIAKAKELGIEDPTDVTVHMLATFFE